MADTTLNDLAALLKNNNNSQEETNDSIQKLTSVFRKKFLKETYGGGDKLEDKIESKASGAGITSDKVAAAIQIPGTGGFDGLVVLGTRLASLIAGVGASITAFLLATQGLRGWELSAIKNLDKVKTRLVGLIPDTGYILSTMCINIWSWSGQ